MVQQARKESVKADDLVRSLTPRPNWHKLDAFAAPASPAAKTQGQPQAAAPSDPHAAGSQQQKGLPSASTRELVERLATERKQALARVAELEPLQLQLQQANSLLEPEAGPGSVQLQLVDSTPVQSQTPASASDAPAVVTATAALSAVANDAAPSRIPVAAAGSDAARSIRTMSINTSAKADTGSIATAGAAGSSPGQAFTGHGWSNSIPRYLRWGNPVVLQPYLLEGLYSTLQDIWAGKAAFDGQRQAHSNLIGFLWTYFRAELGEQQGLVAQAGYSFLYALQQHQHQLGTAAVFLKILEGQWQEAHWHDCRHMLDAVALVLEALGMSVSTDRLLCKD